MASEIIADDLLVGAAAITNHTGEMRRRINYLLEKGDLPAFKMRGRWYMRKSSYKAHLEKLEEAAMRKPAT
jgi:hypothetical protein